MSDTARRRFIVSAPLRGPRCRAAESDVLDFLMRTLHAHCRDGDPHDILVKLHNLKRTLDQQENKLSDWPDSPSKERICEALVRAKTFVVQMVDDYRTAAQ